jgi:hypothetical protein
MGDRIAANMNTKFVGDTPFWQERGDKHLCQIIVELRPWRVLWLDRAVSIDTQLIARITVFPSTGEDPLPLFTDKAHEKALEERMKEKYGTFRGAHGLDVANINDDIVRFDTGAGCKLLRKCHKDQVPARVIAVAEKCVAGVMMNWSTFMVNQFLMDCREAHEKGTEFHYAWLLILIALTVWRELEEMEFLEGMQKPFLVARYVSLWHTAHKNKQMDNNITFYIYKETIRQCIEYTLTFNNRY